MRALLFIVSTIISFSFLLLEDVVAQQRGGWDLPAIPTPGKRGQPKTQPAEVASTPEGECDRKKNNSLACRRDVFQGRQAPLVNFSSAEGRLFGTWTIRTLVTMSEDARPKEIEINPKEVPIRGLTWSAAAVSSVSDVPRGHRVFDNQRPYRIREDGVTIDLYLSGENVPELAFICRMVRFSSSGDNLVCIYHEAPAGEVRADTKYVAKGYMTLTRQSPPRRQPEVAQDPYYRQSQPPYDNRRRSPFFW